MRTLLVVFLFAFTACQQQTPPAVTAINPEEAEALVGNYVSAIIQCDVTAYNNLFHTDADVFPIGPTGLIPASQLQEGVKETCDEGITYDMQSINIAVRSLEDIVVATYEVQGYRIVPPADSGAIHARFTLVLSEKNGKLSIEHLHASPI